MQPTTSTDTNFDGFAKILKNAREQHQPEPAKGVANY